MNMKMRRIVRPLVVATLVLTPLATNLPAQTIGRGKANDVRKAIEGWEGQFSVLFASGNTDELAELYTDDAEVMAPNSPPVSGRSAIREFWDGVRKAGIVRIDVKTLETSRTGVDTIFEVGKYTLYGVPGYALDDGKYIVIWRREGNRWMLYRDIWNSNRK